MDITKLLSDPVWNGIQGVITIITFLYLLKEKKSELALQIKKFISIFMELVKIFVLVFWGWFFTYFFFFTFSDLLIVVLQGILRPPINYNDYFYNIITFPPKYIKLTIPASFAAMSTLDNDLSKKRAIFVGNIASAVLSIYFGFLSKPFFFLQLFKSFKNAPDEIQFRLVDYLLFGFIVLFAAYLGTLLQGNLTGVLSAKGVSFGRKFISKLTELYNQSVAEKIKLYLQVLKKYLPK